MVTAAALTARYRRPSPFPRRRPTSHRKQAPMPVWQAVCLSVIAAGVLMVFTFGLIALLAVAFT